MPPATRRSTPRWHRRRSDLRSRRDNATFNLVYSLNRDLDVKFNVRNSARSGNNVHSFGFGTSPGLNPSVEIGVPMDDRTTDVKGALEFANAKSFLSVGYNGSWFDNQIPIVRFDNRCAPLTSRGPSVQAVMWPNNTSFTVNANDRKLARKTRRARRSDGQTSQNDRFALRRPTRRSWRRRSSARRPRGRPTSCPWCTA
jgi:hypothetical protein